MIDLYANMNENSLCKIIALGKLSLIFLSEEKHKKDQGE